MAEEHPDSDRADDLPTDPSDGLSDGLSDDLSDDLPDRAAALYQRANRLAAVGRREEALAALTRAVAVYRTLAERRPGTYAEVLRDAERRLGELGEGVTGDRAGGDRLADG